MTSLIDTLFHCGWHFSGLVLIATLIGWFVVEFVWRIASLFATHYDDSCAFDPDEIVELVRRDLVTNGQTARAVREIVRTETADATVH